MVRILLDDGLVRLDRLAVLLEFLGELAEQIRDPRHVLGIGIILHDLAQHAPARLQIGLGLGLARQSLVALEQFEVAFGDVELGLHGQRLVAEQLAECLHLAVGADHHLRP